MPATDPFRLFAEIFAKAEALGIEHANASHLATVQPDGRPSVRVVLLKGFDTSGFVFYGNLESLKGVALAADPRAELNFYWRELDRQIRIAGEVTPVSEEEADAYFASRPRLSQLGAWASRQSRELPSHVHLLAEVAKLEARYIGRKIPRPPHWSGWRLAPRRFEFWRARPFRLHQRHEFTRQGKSWRRRTLYP
jgi:pyridoxamine 5'-phosphate oxidase